MTADIRSLRTPAVFFTAFNGFTLDEEQERHENKDGDEDAAGPAHIAEEAGHGDAVLLGDGADHEVRGVADIGIGAHEHGATGNSRERRSHIRHQVCGIPAGRVEEDHVGRGIVEEARQGAGEPEEGGVDRRPG